MVIEEEANGLIREFPKHVKVVEILRERPSFFFYHADSIFYNEFISLLSVEQELQVRHLYFFLPLAKLSRRLLATDMAVLVVEAIATMEWWKNSK